jgi:hypothetical protein
MRVTFLLIFFFFFLSPALLLAQVCPGCPETPPPDPGPPVPIGGIEYLIAAGVCLGIITLRKSLKVKES